MSYKLIKSTGKNGLRVCQHYKPIDPEQAPSCANCSEIDGEVQTLNGIVTGIICKLRATRTPDQIEALQVSREIPRKKITKIGHHHKKNEEQGELLDRGRLSREKLNKENLNLFQ